MIYLTFFKAVSLIHFGSVLVVLLVGASNAAAQTLVTSPFAPPPLKFISSEERSQISREGDAKKRLRLSVELADARLRRAEELTAAQRYEAATDQLSSYQTILEEAFVFMRARTKIDNKTRDLYKYLELNMRAHAPRLEAVRRTTPAEYAVYVRSVFEFTREARTTALNSFYGDTVLKDPPSAVRPPSSPPPREEAVGGNSSSKPKEP